MLKCDKVECCHALHLGQKSSSILIFRHCNIIAVVGDGRRHCREACYMRSHVSQIQADLPGPRMYPRVPLHLLPRRLSSARSGVPFSCSRRGKMLSRISQSARALCAWLGAIPKCSLKSCCIVNQSINQSIYSLCLEESYASQQTMIGESLSMLSLNGTVEANLQLSKR